MKTCRACGKENCKKGKGWNYRMIRSMDGEDYYFAIHEVYYNHEGKANAWSAEPIYPGAASPNGLLEEICRMEKAFFLPSFEIKKDGEKEELVEIEVNGVTGKNR